MLPENPMCGFGADDVVIDPELPRIVMPNACFTDGASEF